MPTKVYVKRMRSAIGCPILWEKYLSDTEFRRVLFLYWAEICQNYQADYETDHYYQKHCLEYENENILAKVEANVKFWRNRAIEEYISKTKFLFSYRLLSEKEHSKHWIAEEKNRETIVRSTQKGPAKFFYRFPISALEEALYEAVVFSWRRIVEGSIRELYVEFNQDVGAASGKPTPFVRFYIDHSKGVVHARPILPNDKPSGEPWLKDRLLTDIWPDWDALSEDLTIDEELEFERVE